MNPPYPAVTLLKRRRTRIVATLGPASDRPPVLDELIRTGVAGGTLKDRKGMNLPGVAVSAPALTDKDRDDARFALGLGVDFLALSFVRRPDDVADLKRLIAEQGHDTPVVAKIEKPEALACVDDILAAADGVMVARGDLGVELSPEVVPIAQQDLVQ